MFFNSDVSTLPPAATSTTMLSALRAAGGWGNNDVMQIDFSIDVLTADNTTPMRTFTPTGDFFSPDCDHVPMPVPVNGNLESETGYTCTTGGDCHLIVYQRDTKDLYEMWRADIRNGTFYGGCLAVWHGAQTYSNVLRGDQCTSADAAGFPIAPLLFTADEVAAGHIDHAIRFILPSDRMGRGFVRPATHAIDMGGAPSLPPFGFHLRLRADYPLGALPSEGARVVARALQRYGMYHADRGEIALTAQSDRRTAAKWDGLLGERDLAGLRIEDFEVVDHGDRLATTFRCQR
jgi:serine/threonine-protein kinase